MIVLHATLTVTIVCTVLIEIKSKYKHIYNSTVIKFVFHKNAECACNTCKTIGRVFIVFLHHQSFSFYNTHFGEKKDISLLTF